MARSTLCVSCASLPIKDREAATRVQQCPQCQAEVGITSYGVCCRVRAAKPLMTRQMLHNVLIGSGLMAVLFAGGALHLWMRDSVLPPQAGEPVVINANGNLLANAKIKHHPAVIERKAPTELRGIPEVALTDFPQDLTPKQADEDLRHLMAQIRQENNAKQDGFLLAHMVRRPEIRGLPFIMGDDCKLEGNKGQELQTSVQSVRTNIDAYVGKPDQFFSCFNDVQTDAAIAALTQILGPETTQMRTALAQNLARSHNAAASKTLAKAAIFDTDGDVRYAALKALKNRPAAEYSDVLMHGMRYPLPVVAERAAQAIMVLKHTDLLPQLADFLGETAPGDPVACQDIGRQRKCVAEAQVHMIREVVRINHHRNCFLCHAPVGGGHASEVPAMAPSPGTPFPRLSQEYYGDRQVTNGSPAVRADTTYLRQDFSIMMHVANAAPWPDKQRFDFLVRTRVVAGDELADLRAKIASRPANYLSVNHKAALAALRDLTGQDADPNPAAWRRVLAKNQAED